MPGTFSTLDTVRKLSVGETTAIYSIRAYPNAGWHLTYVQSAFLHVAFAGLTSWTLADCPHTHTNGSRVSWPRAVSWHDV
jgi:hypothetical protein